MTLAGIGKKSLSKQFKGRSDGAQAEKPRATRGTTGQGGVGRIEATESKTGHETRCIHQVERNVVVIKKTDGGRTYRRKQKN